MGKYAYAVVHALQQILGANGFLSLILALLVIAIVSLIIAAPIALIVYGFTFEKKWNWYNYWRYLQGTFIVVAIIMIILSLIGACS